MPAAIAERIIMAWKSSGWNSHLSKLEIPKAENKHGKIEANESATSGIDDNAVCRLRRQE